MIYSWANPPCGGISPNPPGPEGSKGKWALPGARGALLSPSYFSVAQCALDPRNWSWIRPRLQG